MSTLEKQLIAINAHGIWIEFAHGHRWICSSESVTGFDFSAALESHSILVNNKIYGGVIEAILVIDEVFVKMFGHSLEQWFDDIIDLDFDIKAESSSGPKSRIDYNTKPGGLH